MFVIILLALGLGVVSTTVAPCNKVCYNNKIGRVEPNYYYTPEYPGWKRTEEIKERR